jgi:hypothetical protein
LTLRGKCLSFQSLSPIDIHPRIHQLIQSVIEIDLRLHDIEDACSTETQWAVQTLLVVGCSLMSKWALTYDIWSIAVSSLHSLSLVLITYFNNYVTGSARSHALVVN